MAQKKIVWPKFLGSYTVGNTVGKAVFAGNVGKPVGLAVGVNVNCSTSPHICTHKYTLLSASDCTRATTSAGTHVQRHTWHSP